MAPAQSYWRQVWRRFTLNPLAIIGLWVSICLILIACFADFIANDKPYYMIHKDKTFFPIALHYLDKLGIAAWPSELRQIDFTQLTTDQAIFPPIPYAPNRIDLLASFAEPSREHWLGTDNLGRDVMSGIIHGARISLSIGFVSVGIAVLIGITLGALSGYLGGWVDLVISRVFELMLSIPTFFLIITVAATLTPNIFYTMIVIGLTSWVGIARLTRSEFLKVRNLDYIAAAIAAGASTHRIMLYHILPNALAPVLVSIVIGIATAILIESSLSFLGIGVPADLVTWGSILNEARSNTFAWWLAIFPGAAIFLAVVAYYVVGEGLRDALDPRLK